MPPLLAVIVTTVEGRVMRCAKGKGVMKNDDVGDRRGRFVFFLVFLAGADSRQQMSLLYVVYVPGTVLYCPMWGCSLGMGTCTTM